jgi:hypothetical protein
VSHSRKGQCFGQAADDHGVAAVQMSGSGKGTVERKEDHRKHNGKGSMEATEWIRKGL